MLINMLYEWNPFNLFGNEVCIDELIGTPLTSHETLRLDGGGRCRRIQATPPNSSIWRKALFWVQTHVHGRDHLHAIDALISHFYNKLLQDPPKIICQLQKFNEEVEVLHCLKRDYGFVHLKIGDPALVEARLFEIKQHAYSIFEFYHKQCAIQKEEERKRTYTAFKQQVDLELHILHGCHEAGLQKARILSIADCELLQFIFEERMDSLEARLRTIQKLQMELNEMERIHETAFTVPMIKEYVEKVRRKLYCELDKITFELEVVVQNLIINSHISPWKDQVKAFLEFQFQEHSTPDFYKGLLKGKMLFVLESLERTRMINYH